MVGTQAMGRHGATLRVLGWDGSSLGDASLAGAGPLGFAAGDTNLYRYVGNDPVDEVDPSGLQHFPSEGRGKWVGGTRGDGVFEYSNTPQNQEAGLAGRRIRFTNQAIGIGGFPAEFYYKGSATAASVEIATIKGTTADFSAADKAMREKLGDPTWKRPTGYTWNHAGDASSRTMELIETRYHSKVAHSGSAATPRANMRASGMQTGMARAVAGLNVYLTLRDAAQIAGVLNPDFVTKEADYYFVDENNSVFTVQPSGWFSSARCNYVAGPRAGQSTKITDAEVEAYKMDAEAKWGRYVPGSIFHEPRFIPGTERNSLPLMDNWNRQIGHVDENGVHRYSENLIGPPMT